MAHITLTRSVSEDVCCILAYASPYEEVFNYLLSYGLSRGGKWECFYDTYIAGANHPNSDGTPRLEVLRRCRVGETLKLVREPENPHQSDLCAIKVCRENGEQLGYMPEHTINRAVGGGWCFANDIDRGVVAGEALGNLCKG